MTPRRRAPLVLMLLAATLAANLGGSAAAQAPAELPSLFPRRAPLSAPPGELARLDVPAEVLAACRPDLSDLRIFGPGGEEVPYAVLEGLAPDRRVEVRETVTPEVRDLDLDRGLGRSAERQGDEDLPFLRSERFVLPPPPTADGEASDERWDLVVLPDRRGEVVRRVTVTDLRGEPWERVEDEPGASRLLASGSIFRVLAGPDGRRLDSMRVPLPRLAPGTGELYVVLEGRDDEHLRPTFRYERVREIAGAERARVPLTILETRSEGDRTVLEVERPRGMVPDRLEIESATPAFDRRVEVWDRGPGAAGPLGWGSVRRVGSDSPEGDRAIPLRRPSGDRLRIEIRDGDSPPLDDLRVFAALRRPALVFALPAGGAQASRAGGTLYFGGGRARVPHYDLQSLADLPAIGDSGRLARRLWDPVRLPLATLGAPEANPRYEATPALAFAQRPGAPLETERWAWRRPIEARPSPEGLVRLRLAPEDLARARSDLADLRLVTRSQGDDAPRQWAYLLGDGAVRERRELEVANAATEDGATVWELVPPAGPVPLEGVTPRIDAPFFDREYRLEGVRGERTWTIASGRLRLPPRDPRPVEIAFEDGPERVDRLRLTIRNGGDAPLDLTGAAGWLPLPEIYFAAPAGDYDLLLGNPAAGAPDYELARVRDVVLAVSAGEAETGGLEANPGHHPGLRSLLTPGAQKILLWTVLTLAVLGLVALTLRLARSEG